MNLTTKRTVLKNTMHKTAVIALSAMAILTFAISAQAGDLVFNGNFEMTTSGPGQMGYNTDATGWTSPGGYNFIFGPGMADNGGVTGQFGNVQLWGPGNGSNNGLPATSPAGGNFIAADGAFQVAPIQQTLTGLTKGDSYTVGFWWAGAQQHGFTGATTEQWQVSFGNQEQSTIVVHDPSHGFTGWMYQTFTFTADNTSDLLSFLAAGTPDGLPPFVLLDGVSVVGVPEPATLAVMVGGLIGGFGAFRLRNRVKP